MGFNFRKRFRLLPMVNLNVTQKGPSSVSIGGKGVTLNIGKKTKKLTLSIPGTGLSYTKAFGIKKQPVSSNLSTDHDYAPQAMHSSHDSSDFASQEIYSGQGKSDWLWLLDIILYINVFTFPFIFVWFLLFPRYSGRLRIFAFIYAAIFTVLLILANMSKP